MDNLRFYVLFNSISVISGRCLDDNERLCAMELTVEKISPRVRIELGPLDSRPALNPVSYRGSVYLGILNLMNKS